MSMLHRKRNRKIRLQNRLGSRRNRILLALFFTGVALASWFSNVWQDQSGNQYLIAATDIAGNTQLSDAQVLVVGLDLGEQGQSYLHANSIEKNWHLTRPVRAGELIPLASLEANSVATCTALRVALAVGISSDIHLGDEIDLWAGFQNSNTSTASQIVSLAALIRVMESSDALSVKSQEIEICLQPDEIAAVVDAIAAREVIVAVASR